MSDCSPGSSVVFLSQIGPRMTLQLTKIEEGMGEGNVLYHSMGKYTCVLITWLFLYCGVPDDTFCMNPMIYSLK